MSTPNTSSWHGTSLNTRKTLPYLSIQRRQVNNNKFQILRIQEAQITFDKKLKALKQKEEQEYAKKCIKDAEEYKKEKQLEERKRIEKMNKFQEDLLAQ